QLAYRYVRKSGEYDAACRTGGEPGVGPGEAVLPGLAGRVAFVGDGAHRFRARIEAGKPDAIFPVVEPWLATTLGRLATSRLAAGAGTAPEALRPAYIRGADIRKATP